MELCEESLRLSRCRRQNVERGETKKAILCMEVGRLSSKVDIKVG